MASIRQELAAIQERLRSEIAKRQDELEAVSITIGIVSREEEAAGKPASPAAEAPSNEPKGPAWAEKIAPVNLKDASPSGKPRW